MNDKKRYAGDYEIIQSMSIGEKEFVLGENMNAVDGKFYIAANYESNELFERYLKKNKINIDRQNNGY